MRLLRIAVAAATLAAVAPAAAQLSNRGIAVESGLSARLPGSARAAPALAVSASTWLDGDVEAVARVAWASAAETAGRRAVPGLSAAAGLRLSLGRAPLRPQVFAELGWARVEERAGAADRAAFGVGGALEWFPAADVSVAARTAVRVAGGVAALDVTLGIGCYF